MIIVDHFTELVLANRYNCGAFNEECVVEYQAGTRGSTFSKIAVAIAVGLWLLPPAHAVTGSGNSHPVKVPNWGSAVVQDKVVEYDARAELTAYIRQISAGEPLWGERALRQLVFEAKLRRDHALEPALGNLATRGDSGGLDRAVTHLALDFMQRHGLDMTDATRTGQAFVAALQSATLDQLFAVELDPLGYTKNLYRAQERYKLAAAAGGWTPISVVLAEDEQRNAPEIGADGVLYNALQTRLSATGDWRGSSIPSARMASANLEFALKRFQTRHQLLASGALDRATLTAMNVSVHERLATLKSNIERAESNPASTERDGVTVNIPAFKAAYRRDGETVWQSDVIVGRNGHETPLLESSIDTVVVNPSWWVPPGLARSYVLPKVKNKPGYIRSHGFQILDDTGHAVSLSQSNWANVVDTANSNLRFRQLPGPQNALGEVKFLFPNRHNVYLHDTNARHLFDHGVRAFSAGCVRLARPMELARAILEQQGYDAARVNAIDADDKTYRVNLEQTVPVRTIYFTADVERDGTVHFYNDIYNRVRTVVAGAQDNLG